MRHPNPNPDLCRDPADGGAPPPEPPRSIAVVSYDREWPARYRRIAAELQEAAGPALTRLEHIGSTAVPGLAGKDLIDVLAGVRSWEAAGEIAAPALRDRGFECYWRSDEPPGYLQFVRRDPTGQRRVHVHMAPAGEPIWGMLDFRDYLRAHPYEAGRYADLKRELAERYPGDRVAYTRGKGEYVARITALARVEARP